MLVPKADRDGLDLGGIRSVEVSAPIATITGWNVRATGRRPDDLCGLSGATVPFAKTKAEREANKDPRPSLEERYGSKDGFVRAVEDAARRLVKERFLLQEDAERYVQAARDANTLFPRTTEWSAVALDEMLTTKPRRREEETLLHFRVFESSWLH